MKNIIYTLVLFSVLVSCQNDDDATFMHESVYKKSEEFSLTPEFEKEASFASQYMHDNDETVYGDFSLLCKWGNYIGTWYSIEKYTDSNGFSVRLLVKHIYIFDMYGDGKDGDIVSSVELITDPLFGCP